MSSLWLRPELATEAICSQSCDADLSMFPLPDGGYMPYWHAEDRPLVPKHSNSAARLAVVILHGMALNGREYFCAGQHAATKYFGDRLGSKVFVVAPQIAKLQSQSDGTYSLMPDAIDEKVESTKIDGKSSKIDRKQVLQFNDDHWKFGQGGFFEAFDELMYALKNRTHFPFLRAITLFGHSAGGQFMQRYAAATEVTTDLRHHGVSVRFVVANPSTFLYFSPLRPRGAPEPLSSCAMSPVSRIHFEVPPENLLRLCQGFDDWPFGLAGKVPLYVAKHGNATALARRYFRQDVVLLAGSDDVCDKKLSSLLARFAGKRPGCEDSGLDTDCEAMLQGSCRLGRARAHASRGGAAGLSSGFNSGLRFLEIPQVGHDFCSVLMSPQGQMVIFDRWAPLVQRITTRQSTLSHFGKADED